eukprot:9468850-Pyramimonas_sp.AAC.1
MVVDARVFAVFVATSLVSDPAEGQPKVVSHWWCHIAKQQISHHKAMFHIMDGSCVAFDADCVVAPGQEITLRPRAEFQNDVQAMNRVDRSFKWMVAYFVMKPDMRPVASVAPNCISGSAAWRAAARDLAATVGWHFESGILGAAPARRQLRRYRWRPAWRRTRW